MDAYTSTRAESVKDQVKPPSQASGGTANPAITISAVQRRWCRPGHQRLSHHLSATGSRPPRPT